MRPAMAYQKETAVHMAVRALSVHEPRRAHLGKITGAAKEPEYMLQWGCTSLHVTHTTLAKYMCEDDSSSSRRHKAIR